ncbi:MAG TPA: hypothetical protein VFI08_14525 [Spirochaetia bacterium]|nr:hypothetical protein [Spirochaetia bacterium]
MRHARPFLLLAFIGVLLGSGQQGTPVRIDTSRTRPPISKYLYGQFIEHLGRSIYGGLWAEMLEDRKFYFIIRDRYAPWGTAEDAYWDPGRTTTCVALPGRSSGPRGR